LTQDHLDYHQTMEAYFETKAAFFLANRDVPAVINVDDPYGKQLFDRLQAEGHAHLYPYAASTLPATFTATGIDASITLGARTIHFHTALCGRYNLANILCAATAAYALGVSADAILMAICEAKPQWGRLEPICPRVFIDYAHTDDALTNVLSTLKECCNGRLICVFGCGGDRDKTKRPRMAAAVQALADVAIVTSDNPRTEDPEAIIHDILAGFTTATPIVEIDRRKAIAHALQLQAEEDIVLIAGEGPEPYQEINGIKYPYSDAEAILVAKHCK
jgi:UDP-N-acetylmuramoyl-L-alanyl-D-glutamate--2,6-diaminopimelate ligase